MEDWIDNRSEANCSAEVKAAFRREALRRRRRIENRAEKSACIAEQFLRSGWYAQAETVFLYLSCRSEADTGRILDQVLRDGKRAAAPRVEGSGLTFYQIASKTDVREGYKGIWEPLPMGEPLFPKETDVILVPGTAFDRRKYRMGYGGGFYDRYLSGLKTGGVKVGLAFEEQIYERVPREAHDIPMDAVITEKGVRI